MYPSHYGNNPLFPSKNDFTVVRKDNNVGCGVITHRNFKKGHIVAAMAGEIIQDIRQHSLQIDSENHLYDIYFSGYFLHSCSPNIYLDMKNLLIYAVKDIEAETYLFMDYAQTEDVLYKQFACCCGSPECRGWITGNRETPNLLLMEQASFMVPRVVNG